MHGFVQVAVSGGIITFPCMFWIVDGLFPPVSFHACRYPVKPCDTATKFDPRTHDHVVFIRKNRFFEVPLASPDGVALSAGELEAYVLFRGSLLLEC